MQRARPTTRVLVAAASIGLAAVLAAVLSLGGGSADRELSAAFASGVNLVKGQEVRVAGVKVGEISSLRYADRKAIVGLRIDDDRMWPLRQGTVARIRYGTTAGNATRYIELKPGSASSPALPNHGIVSRTITPVEFDEMFSIFDRRTRRTFPTLIANLDSTLEGRAGDLVAAVEKAPAGLQGAADVSDQLGGDVPALRTLLAAGDRATRTLAAHDTQLRRLMVAAADTFDEFAHHTDATKRGLETFPATLRLTRRGLRRFDGTIGALSGLTEELRPGVESLRPTAHALRVAMARLYRVAPDATAALRAGVGAAPAITANLGHSVPFLTRLGDVFERLAPMAACIRPYGPEIAGEAATWAGFGKDYDERDHYARIYVQNGPAQTNGTPLTSAQFVKQFPDYRYAMPRPPGLNVGQPWFLPQCGAGREALDPARDPESGRNG